MEKLLLQIKRIMNSSTSHNIEQIGYHGYVNTEIEQLILESFKVEKPIYEQLRVAINQVHAKYFDISCVPILTRSQKVCKGFWL